MIKNDPRAPKLGQHPNIPTHPNTDSRELRDILGCACSYNGQYDGKSYNLKTERYEDCECLAKIEALNAYTANKQHEQAKKSFDLGWNARGAELVKAQKELLDSLHREIFSDAGAMDIEDVAILIKNKRKEL